MADNNVTHYGIEFDAQINSDDYIKQMNNLVKASSEKLGDAMSDEMKNVFKKFNDSAKQIDMYKHFNFTPIYKGILEALAEGTADGVKKADQQIDKLQKRLDTLNWVKKDHKQFVGQINALSGLNDVDLSNITVELEKIRAAEVKANKIKETVDKALEQAKRLGERDSELGKGLYGDAHSKYGAPSDVYKSYSKIIDKVKEQKLPDIFGQIAIQPDKAHGIEGNIKEVGNLIDTYNQLRFAVEKLNDTKFGGTGLNKDGHIIDGGFLEQFNADAFKKDGKMIDPQVIKEAIGYYGQVNRLFEDLYKQLQSLGSPGGTTLNSGDFLAELLGMEQGTFTHNDFQKKLRSYSKQLADNLGKSIEQEMGGRINIDEMLTNLFDKSGSKHQERAEKTTGKLTAKKGLVIARRGDNKNADNLKTIGGDTSANAITHGTEAVAESTDKATEETKEYGKTLQAALDLINKFDEQSLTFAKALDEQGEKGSKTQKALNALSDTYSKLNKQFKQGLIFDEIDKNEDLNDKHKAGLKAALIKKYGEQKSLSSSEKTGTGINNKKDETKSYSSLETDFRQARDEARRLRQENDKIKKENIELRKKNNITEDAEIEVPEETTVKKTSGQKGRPVGSKNKPKDGGAATIDPNYANGLISQVKEKINTAINEAFSGDHSPIKINAEQLKQELESAVATAAKNGIHAGVNSGIEANKAEPKPIVSSVPFNVPANETKPSDTAPVGAPITVNINTTQLKTDVSTAANEALTKGIYNVNINKEQIATDVKAAVNSALGGKKFAPQEAPKEEVANQPKDMVDPNVLTQNAAQAIDGLANNIEAIVNKIGTVQEAFDKLHINQNDLGTEQIKAFNEALASVKVEDIINFATALSVLDSVDLSKINIAGLDLANAKTDGVDGSAFGRIATALKKLNGIAIGNIDMSGIDLARLQTAGVEVDKFEAIVQFLSNLKSVKTKLNLDGIDFTLLDTSKLNIDTLERLGKIDFSNLKILKNIDLSKLNTGEIDVEKLHALAKALDPESFLEVLKTSHKDKTGKIQTTNELASVALAAELKKKSEKLKAHTTEEEILKKLGNEKNDGMTLFNDSNGNLKKAIVRSHSYEEDGAKKTTSTTMEVDKKGNFISSDIHDLKYGEKYKLDLKNQISKLQNELKSTQSDLNSDSIKKTQTELESLLKLIETIKSTAQDKKLDINDFLPQNIADRVDTLKNSVLSLNDALTKKQNIESLKNSIANISEYSKDIWGKDGKVIDEDALTRAQKEFNNIGDIIQTIKNDGKEGLFNPSFFRMAEKAQNNFNRKLSSNRETNETKDFQNRLKSQLGELKFYQGKAFNKGNLVDRESLSAAENAVKEINRLIDEGNKNFGDKFADSIKKKASYVVKNFEDAQKKSESKSKSSSYLDEYEGLKEQYKDLRVELSRGFDDTKIGKMQEILNQMRDTVQNMVKDGCEGTGKINKDIKQMQRNLDKTVQDHKVSEAYAPIFKELEEYARLKKQYETDGKHVELNGHLSDEVSKDKEILDKKSAEIASLRAQIPEALFSSDQENRINTQLEVLDKTIKQINESSLTEFSSKIDSIKSKMLGMTETGEQQFHALETELQKISEKGTAVPENLRNAINGFEKNGEYWKANAGRVGSIAANYENWKAKNSRAVYTYSDKVRILDDGMSKALDGKLSRKEVESLAADFKELNAQANAAGKSGATMLDMIGSRFKNLAVYLSSFISVFTLFNKIREGVGYVKELDTSMTNLRKVAEGTSAQIDDFGKSSYKVADALGTVNTAVVDAATEWSRLGYNIKEASELAKASVVFANVGEMDAGTATTSLVSALKAFDKQSDEAMSLVDKFDNIANNYAVNATQLGEIVEKSAAAIAVGGDGIDQLLAMGAAMNEVVQDASVTGNTIKTVALRIRGAKTELEEANLETDNMAESTSKLRAQIAGLTNVGGKGGFDIMKDADTFKTTYEIFDGIAQRWEDMSNIKQAALLELLAGKQRAQGVAALLSNWDKAKEALDDSINSEGTAMAENDKYMQSIEAHQAKMTNAWKEVWNSAINRDAVNFFVDLGTTIAKLTKDVGLFQTAFSAMLGVMYTKSAGRDNGLFKLDTDDMGNRHLVNPFNSKRNSHLFDGLFHGGPTTGILSESDYNALTSQWNALKGDGSNLEEYSKVLNKVLNENKDATDAIKQGTAALAKQTIAANGAIPSYQAYSAAIKADNAAQKASTISTVAHTAAVHALNLAASFGASIIASVLISAIVNATHATENAIKAGKDAQEAIQEINSSFKETADLVDNSGKKFAELSEGVDANGKNVSLTADEYQEFLDINNKLAEAFPTLTRSYDENGNALVNLGDNVKDITQNLNDLLETERKLANKQIAEKLGDTLDGIQAQSDKYESESSSYELDADDYEKRLNRLISGDFKKKIKDELSGEGWLPGGSPEDVSLRDEILARLGVYDGKSNEEALDQIDAVIEEYAKEIGDKLSEAQDEITKYDNLNKANWNGIIHSLTAYAETTNGYDTLTPAMQNVVRQAVGNIDWSQISFGGSEQGLKDWVNDNLIGMFDGSLKASDGSQISSLIETYLADKTKFIGGKMELGDYQKEIEDFYKKIENLDPDVQKAIHFIVDIDTDGKGTTIQQSIEKIKRKLNKDIPDLDKKLKGLSFKELDIASKLEISSKTKLSWEELVKLIHEVSDGIKTMPTVKSLEDINKEKSGLDALFNKYESGTTVTTSTGSKLAKGGASTTFKGTKQVKTDNALSLDDVSATIESNPEYINYITKIGDQYVLNENAMKAWNKSIEEQKKLVDTQLGGWDYLDQYNEYIGGMTNIESHQFAGGIGQNLGPNAATVQQLDDMSVKMIELNNDLRDGKIALTDFYTQLNQTSNSSGLFNSLENINGEFSEGTEYIQEMSGMLTAELSSSLVQSTKQVGKGTKSLGTYSKELFAASKNIDKLATSMFGLTDSNKDGVYEFNVGAEATEEFKKAAEDAAGVFGEFKQTITNVDGVQDAASVLTEYHDLLVQYSDESGHFMDSFAQDTNYDDFVSEFSNAFVEMANSSEEQMDRLSIAVSNALDMTPEKAENMLREVNGKTDEAAKDLANAIGGNVGALEGLANAGAKNIGTVLGELADKAGDILTSLGDAISNFHFEIKIGLPKFQIPSLKDLIQKAFTGEASNVDLGQTSITFDGSGSAEALGNAVKAAGDALKNIDFSNITFLDDMFSKDGSGAGTRPAQKRPDSKNQGSGGGSGKDKAQTEKDYDWSETYEELMKDKYSKIQEYLEDTANAYDDVKLAIEGVKDAELALEHVETNEQGEKTVLGRISALHSLIEMDEELIEFYQGQYDRYDKALNDNHQKLLDSFGQEKGEELWTKINNGSIDPEKWKDTFRYQSSSQPDKDKIKLLDDTIEFRKNRDKSEKALRDQQKTRRDNIKKEFEYRQEQLDHYIKKEENALQKLQDQLDLKVTLGINISKSDYKDLIREADSQIDRYEDKIASINENIAKNIEIDPNFMGSSEYFTLEDSIEDCDTSIRNARKQQIEWNEEIKKLPVKRAEQYLNSIQNVVSQYNNFISQIEADGNQANLEQLQQGFELQEKLIGGYQKQLREASKLQRTYQKGSDNWEEMASTIQSAKDGISQAVVEMKNFNQQMLQLPIDNLNKVTTKLQSIKDTLDAIVEDDETVISTAQEAVNRKIENLQKQQEELQKHYEDDLINPLQEQLDLLNKQNEARQRQLALEQARYDLERAHDEKTVQVEKNGELVWAEDEDAVRNAQNSLRDAEFAEMIGRLQDQIDAYNKELDDANKKVEKQVDLWEKIAEEWAKLSEDNQYNQNLEKSLEILKKQFPNIDEKIFEDMSMSGKKSELYEKLKQAYNEDTRKQTDVQRQIDQNGRATTLMERVKELVTNGTLSATEANTILNRIQEASKDGFSSLEALEETLTVEQTTSIKQAIQQAQTATEKSYTLFQHSLNAVQSNTGTIAKYSSVWETIKKSAENSVSELNSVNKNLKSIEDAIEDLDFNFEQPEEKPKKEKSHSSGGSSSSGFVYEYGSNAKSGSRPKGGDIVKYKDSKGNVIDMIIGKNAHYAKGIENGPVQADDTLRTNILKRLATSNLKKGEVPIVADVGEVILNPNQQEQVLANFRNAVMNANKLVPVGVPTKSNDSPVNVTFGDIHIEGVQDPDGFAKALNNEFELAINQNYSKIFRH